MPTATKDTKDSKKALAVELRHLRDTAGKETKQAKDQFTDVNVQNDEKAKTITLPGKMQPLEAVKWLKKFDEQQNTEVNLYIPIEGSFPLDGLVNFYRVLKDVYGWTCLVPTPGFFGDTPPTLLDVPVGPGKFTQVHWGNVAIPGVSGHLTTAVKQDGNRVCLAVSGTIKRKDEQTVKRLMEAVRLEMREHSIYRKQAITVSFRDDNGKVKDFNILDSPKYMDLSQVDVEQLIFPKETAQMFTGTLLLPVKQSDRCRAAGVPLKRGVLLEGPFGTGKSLAAQVAAKTCIDNGWTFIYLKDCRDLDRGLAMAEMYAPCMLFAEDIDRAVEGERSAELDRILNILDGVGTKDLEIITVLTTNNVGIINKAMLRPGRIDSLIRVGMPDADAAVRLVRRYGEIREDGQVVGSMIHATNEELEAALRPILGNNAAAIRESVERAKMFAMERDLEGVLPRIEAQDIALACSTMAHHMSCLNQKTEDKPHPFRVMGEGFADATLASETGKLMARALTGLGETTHSNGHAK